MRDFLRDPRLAYLLVRLHSLLSRSGWVRPWLAAAARWGEGGSGRRARVIGRTREVVALPRLAAISVAATRDWSRWGRQWWAGSHLFTAVLSLALAFFLAVALLPAAGWAPAPGVVASPETYTVKPGDTISHIAQRFGVGTDQIVVLNSLTNADLIYAGQTLVLEQAPAAAPPEEAAAGAGVDAAEQLHTIREGDTIWQIALDYRVDFDALIERNQLIDYDWIQVGQTLVIPPPDARATGTVRGGARENPGGRIWVPFRSQLDGSPYAGSNCGPATLGMLMAHYGEWWLISGIRRSVNEYQGTWSYDSGSSWEAMAYAARERGFQVVGLYEPGGGYRQWTIEDMVEHTRAGRPVMLMVRYWSLPGHADAAWWGDHYIAFLGLTPSGDVVYHDPAFPEERGAYRVMSQEQLTRAWTRTATGLQHTAMALHWPGE